MCANECEKTKKCGMSRACDYYVFCFSFCCCCCCRVQYIERKSHMRPNRMKPDIVVAMMMTTATTIMMKTKRWNSYSHYVSFEGLCAVFSAQSVFHTHMAPIASVLVCSCVCVLMLKHIKQFFFSSNSSVGFFLLFRFLLHLNEQL